MLAYTRSQPERRGIVLVLVLAMLGLLALVGVTFATFSGQARINTELRPVAAPAPGRRADGFRPRAIDHRHRRSAVGDPRPQPAPRHVRQRRVTTATYPSTRRPASPFPSRGSADPRSVRSTMPIPSRPTSPRTTPIFTATTSPAGSCASPAPGRRRGRHRQPDVRDHRRQPIPGRRHTGRTFTCHHPDRRPADIHASQRLLQPGRHRHGHNRHDAEQSHAGDADSLPGLARSSNANTQTGSTGLSIPSSSTAAGCTRSTGRGWAPTRSRQLPLQRLPRPGGPNSVGMDEDYDACDLENWFLAIQSADGQVMIPSFHRPGIIRYDPNNDTPPTIGTRMPNPTTVRRILRTTARSASRILRPVAADGHDPTTFPDLIPDPTTGKITYDVDNDGDGVTDSVWLDLGYPARRDSRGQLYKPLFAFMVIGLNGRIPLNTAGNLAATPAAPTPQHLGNSVSEIDPTYALQNAYRPTSTTLDPFNQLGNGSLPADVSAAGHQHAGARPTPPTTPRWTTRSIRLNAIGGLYQPIDVRLTQLRNLLAGTRPQLNPLDRRYAAAINGDTNYRLRLMARHGCRRRTSYYMPNGIADLGDTADSTGHLRPQRRISTVVQRTTPPVAGRWGEAASVPGVPFANPNSPALPLQPGRRRTTPTRSAPAIRSTSATCSTNLAYNGTATPLPRDAADDNYNAFDVYPRLGRTPRANDGRGRRRSTSTTPPAASDPAGRADAAVRDAGRHQRHRARGAVDHAGVPATTRDRTGRRQLRPRPVLQLFPPGRVARRDQRQYTYDGTQHAVTYGDLGAILLPSRPPLSRHPDVLRAGPIRSIPRVTTPAPP